MPGSDSEVTSGSPAADSKYPTFTPSSSVSIIQLTRDNYHLWLSQIEPYLIGQGVFGYVDGSIPPPEKLLTGNNGVSKPNPEFQTWKRNDSAILTTLSTSLSIDVLRQVYQNRTAASMWTALKNCFAAQSRARVHQLHASLLKTQKDHLSIADYYTKVKTLVDDLAMAGQPVSDVEFIGYVLRGLGEDYEALIQGVHLSKEMTSDELYALLLSAESRVLDYKASSKAVVDSPQANYTKTSNNQQQQRSNNSGKARYQQQSSHPQQYNQQPYRSQQNSYRGRGGRDARGGRGGRQQQNSGDPSVQCQICAKFGHVARECYFRYRQSSDPNAIQPPMRSPPPPPHAYAAYSYPGYSYPPPPYAGYTGYAPPTDWIPDSGATHHITNDLSNLNMQSEPYDGPEQVRVGDGSGLKITLSGTSVIHTPMHTFHLSNIIVSPSLTKNLLWVHKFALVVKAPVAGI